MTDLTRTQWMWVIGISVAILILGSVGWYFSTRGQLGMQGAQFQTGFGVGGPAMYKAGNPHSFVNCKTSGGTMVRCPAGTTRCDDKGNCYSTRSIPRNECDRICKDWQYYSTLQYSDQGNCYCESSSGGPVKCKGHGGVSCPVGTTHCGVDRRSGFGWCDATISICDKVCKDWDKSARVVSSGSKSCHCEVSSS